MQLFLVGGFLGSGKTTAIYQACHELIQQNIPVGVVTNDQGVQLVDTLFIRYANIPVREVTNGCFCCQFDQLQQSMQALTSAYHPEIIFAESVGSCTDLVATVVKPLQQFSPQLPVCLSVFADATSIVPLLTGSRVFVDQVKYIYKKQLDEADVLIINKIDLLDAPRQEAVQQLLKKLYPGKTILYQCSFNKENIAGWIRTVRDFTRSTRQSLALDYDLYGAGEAALGWFDAEWEINSCKNQAVQEAYELINNISLRIQEQNLPIGHIKFLVDDGMKQTKISLVSHNTRRLIPEGEPDTRKIKMLINARVQATPAQVEEVVQNAIEALQRHTGCRLTEIGKAAFQPGYPKPTYRIADESKN